jgi:tetratricopeptide (TPR) repeat protein
MDTPATEIALLMEVGHICRYARRYREAREIFQGVAALLPAREAAYLALAAVACDERKFEEAETLCRRILTLNPRSAAAYAQLAEIDVMRGNSDAALKTLKMARDCSADPPMRALIKSLEHLAQVTAVRMRSESAATKRSSSHST